MCMGVCVSLCVCVQERERVSPAWFPPSLYASLFFSALPRSISPPRSLASLSFLLYTFFLHLSSLYVSLCLSFSDAPSPFPPPPPPPLLSLSLSPPLSFSSSASLLAVDVTGAEAEATLPLIGCHSQVSDKEKGERKTGRKAKGEKKGGRRKGENSTLTSQWASVDCGMAKRGRLEAEEEGGRREGTESVFLSSYSECIQKAVYITGCAESDCYDGSTVWCLMSKAIGPI